MKIGTHSNIAKIASRLLDNPSTTPLVRKVAASCLTQSKNAKASGVTQNRPCRVTSKPAIEK